jgi:hypothetical protein
MAKRAANNVVLFPVFEREDSPASPPPTSLKEIQERMAQVRAVLVQDSLETVMETAVHQLLSCGFDVTEDEHHTEVVFLVEAMRSLLLKTIKLDHPFQELAKATFVKVKDADDEENETFEIAPKINIKFKKK